MLTAMFHLAPYRPLVLLPLLLGLVVALTGCRQEAPQEPDTPSQPEGSTAAETSEDPEPSEPAAEDSVGAGHAAAAADAGAPDDASADNQDDASSDVGSAEASALPDLSDWNTAEGHQGQISLSWRPVDHDEIPRNVECELDVMVLADGAPLAGANLRITGYMPAHRHGLVQLPLVEELGDGAYRVSGLLLHMRGDWELRFTVVAEGKMETVTFELVL
jgi:hypothetical protein